MKQSIRRRCIPAVFLFGLVLAFSWRAAAQLPTGFPGSDYPLDQLINEFSSAVFDPDEGVIRTTGQKAKLVLPAMPEPGENVLRAVEVDLSPASVLEVHLTWFDGDVQLDSEHVVLDGSERQTVAIDLTEMVASNGAVRLRINGMVEGTVVHRVSLIERMRPNLVVILLDDLRQQDLELGFGRSLPSWDSALAREFMNNGAAFRNFVNTTPLCCPSRASLLTGRYAHNTGIYTNNYLVADGNAGWKKFWEEGLETRSIGAWLQSAGYRTALVGKFLNGYPDQPFGFVPEDYVPPGWDEWYGAFLNEEYSPESRGGSSFVPNFDEDLSSFSYSLFRMNENGSIVVYGDDETAYLTDVERDHAVDFIGRASVENSPFFLFLSSYSPHGPISPAPRHLNMHRDVTAEPPPSYNESDLGDKPQHIQDGAIEYPSQYFNIGARRKLDMTLAADELIAAVFATLEASGSLENTYVFFLSDNGLLYGEHGIGGKSAPYEESIRVPMYVRGPGLTSGLERRELIANIDLAPTLLELAGVVPPDEIDGESMVELLTEARAGHEWRDVVMVELLTTVDSPNQNHVIPPYFGIRSERHIYVEYETGDRELYDLVFDAFQLESEHDQAPVTVSGPLERALIDLYECEADACREATRRGWPQAMFDIHCDAWVCIFDGRGSFDPDGVISEMRWDFGDGGFGGGGFLEHSFASGGPHTVTLTVIDDEGNAGFVSETVRFNSLLFQDGFEAGDDAVWSGRVPSR